MIYFGRKNQNKINLFIDSLIFNACLNNNLAKEDSLKSEYTFTMLLSQSKCLNNVLLPENVLVSSLNTKNFHLKNSNRLIDIADEILSQKVLDDLFFIPIH